MREVFWVTRAKDNLEYRVVRKFQQGRVGNILADELIELTSAPSRKAFPNWMRRVVALVEIDGEVREMVFLTNNVQWSPQTIAASIAAVGALRSSSRNSSRPCSWLISWATTPMRCAGRCGPPCWFISCAQVPMVVREK